MKYCKKCGGYSDDHNKFCPNCGAALDDQQQTAPDNSDILLGVLSYLSVLAFIPFFCEKNVQFVHNHAVRGVNLFILEMAVNIVAKAAIYIIGIMPVLGTLIAFLISIILWAINVGFLVLCIIGIINVVRGEDKDLPLIDAIQFVKF